MKLTVFILALLAAGCSSGYDSTAECYSAGQFRKYSTPSFTTFTMNVRSGEQSRVDLYVQMPFKHLRFGKNSNGFKASYSMTFIVRNENNEIVQTKEVDRPINARSYEESISSRFDLHFQSFILPPASYTAEVIAVDNHSKLRYRSKESFLAKNFSDSIVTASSILLLENMNVDDQRISVRPILPNSISLLDDSVGMFQEIYNITQNDTITVVDTYSAQTTVPETEGMFPFLMPPYRIASKLCDQPYDSVYFQSDSTMIAQRNGPLQHIRFLPVPSAGASQLVRSIIVRKAGRVDTITSVRSLFLRDHTLRNALSIDEIAGVMKYIMREEEFDSVKAVTGEQRLFRMHRFWDRRGGNERRIEFERKVIEANALFTSCIEGSRTAMGIVYIICGIPDFIDCRGSFIETWYYSIGDRAYSFQFRRDHEHSQNYELAPFSVNESAWQYFVDRWRKKL